MVWKITDPPGSENAKIKWEIVKYTRGRGLDIGCGPTKTFPHFIGVDNCIDNQLFNQRIRPDLRVDDCGDLSLIANQSCDFVFSSHLLEHIEPERVQKVLKEWWRVIKNGGYLVLYLPDEDEYPKVGEEGANPDHKWNVSKQTILDNMEMFGWELVEFQKRNQDQEYSLYFVFRKLSDLKHVFSYGKTKPAKTCGLVRYGAYGDLIQCSSVLAGLKKQGYHVTLYTSPPGNEVILHDPNVDEFYLQGKDQVPNQELGQFWAYQAKKYDKWVNLSESIEGTLLALPGRSVHGWAPLARHKMMNRNYLEVQHEIAGLLHDPQVNFYPTDEEVKWAKKERASMGEFLVMWSLAGSSVHKTWGGLDRSIAAMMLDFPRLNVVLVGGNECVLLEQGWEKEKRVHLRSGKYTIRQTLSLEQQCDAIIGCETGVMNAGCMLPIPKIVFLSHSTIENLTRDWVNTYSLFSEKTTCPGRGDNEAPACHQLHYGWEFCKKTENGLAQCQEDITGEEAYKVMWHVIHSEIEKRIAA